ncbi:MAG: hypothetical protein JWO41_582 [Candidatus Saccharibacteria bacterium]|nr:hypothetical protein [Candidatus Saccharibacteria bacterium]
MVRITHALEHSIGTAYQGGVLLAERQDGLAQLSGLPGATARLIQKLAEDKPQAAASLLDANARLHGGYRYLGSGFDAVAYRRGNTVYKVNRRSMDMTSEKREALVVHRQELRTAIAKSMGPVILPELLTVGPHPLDADIEAMITTQPYCEHAPQFIFQTNKTDVDASALAVVCESYSDAPEVLTDFIARSRAYLTNENCLPDTNGPGNVMLGDIGNGQDIYLVDSDPITKEHIPTQRLVLAQLESLGTALRDHA